MIKLLFIIKHMNKQWTRQAVKSHMLRQSLIFNILFILDPTAVGAVQW